jgi:conjugative transfer signal peptidase TraF
LAKAPAPSSVAQRRILGLAGLFTIAVVAASFAFSTVIKLNLTESMPLGLYAVHPKAAISRGAIVIACPPPKAQRIGVANGYLAPARGLLPESRCAAGSAPLLKYAIALAGDEIEIDRRGLSLNGRRLDSQTAARKDRNGRTLTALPWGNYRLSKDEVWLYSPARYSWDSRYFGPASLRDVIGTATPIWTNRPLADLATRGS